jgi:hypothetical protein
MANFPCLQGKTIRNVPTLMLHQQRKKFGKWWAENTFDLTVPHKVMIILGPDD